MKEAITFCLGSTRSVHFLSLLCIEMPKQTRHRQARRRFTRRLPAKKKQQKGGGRLDKLPVGTVTTYDVPPSSVFPDGRAVVAPRNGAGNPVRGFGNAVELDKKRRGFAAGMAIESTGNTNSYNKHLIGLIGSLPSRVYQTVLPVDKYDETYFALRDKLSSPEILPESLYRPVRDDVLEDFRNNWEFMYIMGHGVLEPRLPDAIVPPRTYVRFNSPGGCRSVDSANETLDLAPMMAFPQTFTLPYEDFLRKMTEHHFDNTGPLESFTSLGERTAVSTTPYPGNTYCTTPRDMMSESTRANCLTSSQKKQTIYGPGENIHEMKIKFSNNPFDLSLIGLYMLPIPFDYVKRMSDETRTLPYKDVRTLSPAELQAEMVKQKDLDSRHYGVDSATLNLRPRWIHQQMSLAQIFADLPKVPVGKVRFLFINSCRGVPFTLTDTGLISNILGGVAGGAPANDGSAVGGAGTSAPAAAAAAAANRRFLPHVQRLGLAERARRKSVSTEPPSENFQKWLANRKIMRETARGSAEHEAASAEVARIGGLALSDPGTYWKLAQNIAAVEAFDP